MSQKSDQILDQLRSLGNPDAVEGMARYGINPGNAYGISIPTLRKLGKEIGTDHQLAVDLWASDIHEARILACYIDDSDQVTEKQMEAWVADFDSWDVCDQVISNLFDKTPFAYHKAVEWSDRNEEFVKRAGFVMMASLAVHDKKAPDHWFVDFFPIITRESTDGRNFVKKAVNWALRHIGKRNLNLNDAAIQTAREIQQIDSKAARWIAANAIRELESEAVLKRLQDRYT